MKKRLITKSGDDMSDFTNGQASKLYNNEGKHLLDNSCEFGLNTPIHAPFWWVFGAHFPQMMLLIVLTPKRTVLGLNHVIWVKKRAYRPRSSSCALDRGKKDSTGQEKSQKGYVSPIWGEAPIEAIYIKIV